MEKITVEHWPVERLRSNARALRKNDGCVERMAAAIREYGFRVPVLARRDGVVVDGELRLKAALHLGMEEVPVVPVDGMTEAQVRAFRLLVNRSATWAEWDGEAVALELAELRSLEVDLSLTGFDPGELDRFLCGLTGPEEPDPDEVPELPVVPASRPGDLWELGPHRVLCGDSTSLETVATVLAGERVDMVWTDPPYNVDYEGKAGRIMNDKMDPESFRRFLARAFAGMRAGLADGGAVYVAHPESLGLEFRHAFNASGFRFAACLVWRKNQSVIGRADYHWQHEPILYGWLPTGPHRWHGDRRQTTFLEGFAGQVVESIGPDSWLVSVGGALLRITGKDLMVEELEGTVLDAAKPARSDLHPTMKPVGLIERMVANSSPRGGLVFDPFAGSGSTLVACERLGRRCRTIELDPRFVDVVVARWEEVSGGQAVHAEEGKTFTALRGERMEAAHAC